MIELIKIIGALGLISISAGVLIKRRKTQDLFYLAGGVTLGIYSVAIKDVIFITLEIVFTLAVLYDLIKLHCAKK